MAFTETPNTYFTSTIDASDFPIKSVKISKSFNAEVVRPFYLQLKVSRIIVVASQTYIKTK